MKSTTDSKLKASQAANYLRIARSVSQVIAADPGVLAGELSSIAERLVRAVGFFRLGEAGGPGLPALVEDVVEEPSPGSFQPGS
jgi:hypothetical protein